MKIFPSILTFVLTIILGCSIVWLGRYVGRTCVEVFILSLSLFFAATIGIIINNR